MKKTPTEQGQKPVPVQAEGLVQATREEGGLRPGDYPKAPASFFSDPPEFLVTPLPPDITEEEKQAVFNKEVRSHARELLYGAARNAVLTMPLHEAAALIREVMSDTLEESALTVPSAAIIAGHSEATFKRIRSQEQTPSNYLLTTLCDALLEEPERGLSFKELYLAVMEHHPDISPKRLKEILPRYCQKKLIDFRAGRYYIKFVSGKEEQRVRRMRQAVPMVFATMAGIMSLDAHSRVGFVRMKGSPEELTALWAAIEQAVVAWSEANGERAADKQEPVYDLVVLSTREKPPEPDVGAGQRSASKKRRRSHEHRN